MNPELPSIVIVNGRLSRAAGNALVQTFDDGPTTSEPGGEPLAVARQGGAEGAGGKLGILFGFKNGGLGKHSIVTRAGSTLTVESSAGGVSTVSDGPLELARITRGEESTVVAVSGTALYTIVADPAGVKGDESYRLRVLDAAAEPVGTLDVILRSGGWNITANTLLDLGFALSDLDYFTDRWLNVTGAPLKFPNLGTRLVLREAPTPANLDILLGVCVDLSVGLRAYVAAMR
ncbi:hypothetical protein [Subtercola endophyticus]|uniref:hypothetical protein n=1 Tax=Subtercola endophyticus TaxID=2895559 RepID=UPI001E285F07|nr:hypothetical protein [Subtercola endophyticus]UFS60521.1 hypothetical protein LQ955_07215 [Subtercola endophyticus]